MPITVLALSGGIASTTLLWHYRREHHRVHCVYLDYGQPAASRELKACERIVCQANRDRRMGEEIDLSVVTLEGFPRELQPTMGPLLSREFSRAGLIILASTIAHGMARGAQILAMGPTVEVLPDDVMHYHFACLLRSVGADQMGLDIRYYNKTRADVLGLALKLEAPIDTTRSCVLPGAWHCGSCTGCRDRKRAFAAASLVDPTRYACSERDEGPTILSMRRPRRPEVA